MPEYVRRYDNHDKSKHALPFDDPHFPPFFRLFKWKILDICVQSVTNSNEYGEFLRFEKLFKPGEIKTLVDKILRPVPVDNPFKQKIARAALDEKTKKQAEAYAEFRVQHSTRIEKRRYIEFFLNKVLFTETGLKIADELVFYYHKDLYGMVHWESMPPKWASSETFINRFYNEAELSNRCVSQKLDKVAGSARGNLILPHFKTNSRTEAEYGVIMDVLHRPEFTIATPFVKDALEEGPVYMIEIKDGEEVKVPAERWTEHHTRLLFVSIPGFKENERRERGEHEDWYFYLLEAMQNDPYNRAALWFLDKNYEAELEQKENDRQRASLAMMKGLNAEESGLENEVVTEIRPQPNDFGYQPDVETTELKLRSYQEELVQPALEGRNCVIVAPTGSGKTEVAIYAALHHIGEMFSNRKAARVVLVVPTIALVAQQKERVLKYCRGKYHVDGFHGSEESKTGNGRRDDVLNSHVAVMTPQILVNMLQSVRQTERLYISDFSMIVLDEVHRASGNHPYVEISRLVQDWAHAKPQIIGLTASLNINATAHVDISRMLESIYEMLAILNTPYLSTITKQENIDELNRHVGKPDDSVEVCDPPSDVDAPLRGFIKRILHTYHTKLCNELDSLVKNRHNAFPTHYLKNFRNAKTDKFELYESFLQSVCQDLNKLNTADKGLAQLYTKYIRVYVEARGIVEVMPPTVALEYMKEALDKLNLNHTLSQFSDFSQNYEALTKNIDHKDPVIVIKLKNTIIEQFRVAPDSRVIIFVTQRSTAQRVCDFLNKSGIMDQFKMRNDGDSVGYVLGVNNSGAVQQSSQEQERVLDRFNNGKLKVLVATSVIEEGLDVTACNLIIKYNCSSGSAIQLIQQRGRARAKNSRSVLLAVSSAVNMKENNALISEKYMKACLTMIVKNTQKQLEIEVEKIKKRLEAERRRELEEQASMRLRHADKSYKVICASCNKHFCKSTAIKKIYSNYMVMEPEIWDHLDLVSRARKVNKMHAADCVSLCNIKCKHCKADIGRAYKIRGVYLPQLAVKELTFVPVHGNRMDTETKGKWKDVEEQLFFVPEAREADFKVMLNALVTSESNMEKKRLLDFDSKQHVKAIEIDAFESQRKEKQRQQRVAAQKHSAFSDEEDEQGNNENQEETEA